jgi:RNA polymerase sigma-70 factor, ECF subfamily
MSDDGAQLFATHRRYLIGIAYRMLGSVAEAEDAVQDAYLRFRGVDASSVREPRAYLAQIVARISLDRLKSARVQRERYVGTWLPEPLVESESSPESMAEDLSIALLLTLERLSPLERAAFLLHDVFDMDYPPIAEVLERSESACRQLVTRAREHVREGRPRFEAKEESGARLALAFASAAASGNISTLAGLLAEDAVLYSDGGGKRRAALNPIVGRERILRFFQGLSRKGDLTKLRGGRMVRINGLPGFVLQDELGLVTLAVETRAERISALYQVSNPDKLRHLS